MKDRYLFRGKRTDNGEWVHGYFMMSEPSQFTKKTRPVIIDSQSGIAEYVDPATIGQCTGIDDKHGWLIFEGDLLQWSEDGDSEIGEVLWKTGGWAIFFGEHVNFMESELLDADTGERIGWEIIGNIHDNPELMKEV